MERQSTDMVPLGRDGFFKDPFFSSTWDEFDQERNQIMSKSKNWSITNQLEDGNPSSSSAVMKRDKISEGKDKWEISVDVSNFCPDNLKVKVTGDVVTVSGSQDTSNYSDDNSSRSSQSFSRSYTLPSGCDPDNVSSTLSNSGQLLVSCPRPYYLQGPSAKALRM